MSPEGHVERVATSDVGPEKPPHRLAVGKTGGVWIERYNGDVILVEGNGVAARFGASNGLGKGRVNQILPDREWFGVGGDRGRDQPDQR